VIELTLDEWFLIWAADKTARVLGLSMTWEKTEHGVIIGMGKSNMKKRRTGKQPAKVDKKSGNRRGGKGGGPGLVVSRRTPYLT